MIAASIQSDIAALFLLVRKVTAAKVLDGLGAKAARR
jgi:uncharacterized membrane protein